MSDNSCPPPPEMSPSEKDDKIGRILKSFGAQSCTNASGSRMSYQEGMIAGGGVGGFGAFGFYGSMSGISSDNYSTNMGCEQIAALSSISRELENKIYCSIMSNKSKVQNIIIQTNDINIIIKGKVTCVQGIEISAKNQSDMEAVSEINSDMKNAIENQIKTTVNQVSDVLQTSETETGASPQGSKTFQDLLAEFKSNTTVDNIMKNVNNIFNEVQQTNKLNLVIESGAELEVKDGKCIFGNFENVNKLVAKAVTKSVMDNIFKDLKDRGIVQTSKVEQQSKSTGFATIYDKLAQFGTAANIAKAIMFVVIGIIVISLARGKSGGGGGGGLFGGSGGSSSEDGTNTKQIVFYVVFAITLIILGSLTIAGKMLMTTKSTTTGSGNYKKSETTEEKNTTLGIIILISGIGMFIYSGYKGYQSYSSGLSELGTPGGVPGGVPGGGTGTGLLTALKSRFGRP